MKIEGGTSGVRIPIIFHSDVDLSSHLVSIFVPKLQETKD